MTTVTVEPVAEPTTVEPTEQPTAQRFAGSRFADARAIPMTAVAARLGLTLAAVGKTDTYKSSACPCGGSDCADEDGFVVNTVTNHFLNRKATAAGHASGSNIDMVLLRNPSWTPAQAVNWLLDTTQCVPAKTNAQENATQRVATATQRRTADETAATLADIQKKLNSRTGALLQSPGCEPLRDYLVQRGIQPDTVKRYRLGASSHGVSLPYVDSANRLRGVKYRRVGEGRGKYWWEGGIAPNGALFGANNLAKRDTLVIVEGEFNCLSIWQECGKLVDVMSPGSSVATLPTTDAWKRWARIICWADEIAVAEAWASTVGHGAIAFAPQGGIDANDMLLNDTLWETVELLLW